MPPKFLTFPLIQYHIRKKFNGSPATCPRGAQQDPQHDGQHQEFGHFQIYPIKSLKIGLEKF